MISQVHSCIIIPAEPFHVHALAEKLRAGDCAEIAGMGITAKRAIWQSYRTSVIVHAGFIDGELAAMFGCAGQILSSVGNPWMLTTAAVEKAPVMFIKQIKREVGLMLQLFPRLQGYVSADYHQACRMLEMVGFSLGEPFPYGVKQAPFREYRMER